MFDGSSIRGFKRIEKSDMYFHPDPATFQVLPWGERESGRTARIICDVADPDGTPFAGDPRVQLKKVLADAKAEGYEMSVGPEAEFFLFKRGEENRPTLDPHDHASYFDVYPDDLAEDTRRDIEDELDEPRLQPRGVAPRGRDRPARDRLPPCRRAHDAPTT